MLENFWRRNKQNAVLGIDISSRSVKLLELSRDGANYRVEHYAVSPLPQGALADNNIANTDAVAEALRMVYRRSRSKSDSVAVAVPGASVISKLIQMPADLREDDMETQISLDADQYIPFPLDEVALDFEIQGLSASNPELVDVLIAACRRETIEQYVDALELAELTPKVVDVEMYALERAYSLVESDLGYDDKAVVAVADIGAQSTKLSVLVDGETAYTKEQAFGGQQLTEQIQRQYGMTAEEAEQAKRDGSLPADYADEVLRPFFDSAARQIERALQFYSTGQGRPIEAVVLAGGVAVVPGIADAVAEALQLDVAVANPFARMGAAPGVDIKALQADAPGLMTACGLALRSFH